MISFRDELKEALSKTGPGDISFLEKQLTDLELFFLDANASSVPAEELKEAQSIYDLVKIRYNQVSVHVTPGQDEITEIKTALFKAPRITNGQIDRYATAREAYFTHSAHQEFVNSDLERVA